MLARAVIKGLKLNLNYVDMKTFYQYVRPTFTIMSMFASTYVCKKTVLFDNFDLN